MINIYKIGRVVAFSPADLGPRFEQGCTVTVMERQQPSPENKWKAIRVPVKHPLFWYADDPETKQKLFCTYGGYFTRLYKELKTMGVDVQVSLRRSHGLPAPDISKLQGVQWRPDQKEVLAHILSADGGVIVCPTAFGKSFCMRQIARVYPTSKIVITVSSLDVAKTIYQELKDFVPDLGFCGTGMQQPRRVTVAVTNSLDRCDFDASLVLVDECFEAGTPVKTPRGEVPIDSVSSGDIVCAAHGVGTVLATSVRQTTEACYVTLTDGTRISTTPSHPFFTEIGWVPACKLAVGQVLFSEEDLRVLRNSVHPNISRGATRVGEPVENTQMLLKILLEEAQEPDARRRLSGKDGEEAVGDRAPSEDKGRERYRANSTTEGAVQQTGRGLVSGIHRENRAQKRGWISASLQGRRGKPGTDDSHRGGRRVALHSAASSAGPKEDHVSGVKRVASITFEKLDSPRVVFNLSVSGHPSYYAGGVLVHNCHTALAPSVVKKLNQFRRAKLFGLTASPEGRSDGGDGFMEALFGPRLYDVSYQRGVAVGNIVQLRVKMYRSSNGPDLSGIDDKTYVDRHGIILNKDRNDIVVRATRELEQELGAEAQILLMVDKIEHAYLLGQQLPEYTIVTGVMPKERRDELTLMGVLNAESKLCSASDRDRYRKAFEKNELKRVIATRVWEKGVDFRDLQGLIRADGLASPIAACQIPGRLSRLGKTVDKAVGVLVDFSDIFSKNLKARSRKRLGAYIKCGWIIENHA